MLVQNRCCMQNQNVQCDINGICKVIKGYESAGNEKKILGVRYNTELSNLTPGQDINKYPWQIFMEIIVKKCN